MCYPIAVFSKVTLAKQVYTIIYNITCSAYRMSHTLTCNVPCAGVVIVLVSLLGSKVYYNAAKISAEIDHFKTIMTFLWILKQCEQYGAYLGPHNA